MSRFRELYPAVGAVPHALTSGVRTACLPLERASKGAKNTAAYNAHSYPTKVPPEGIAPFIEHYTDVGDVVLDPFCGSGMTGLAARQLGRRPVLNDLSFGATHLAWNLSTPCSPQDLRQAADAILGRCRSYFDDIYCAYGISQSDGHLHWTLYSQRVECPHCGHPASIWEDATDPTRGVVAASWPCVECGQEIIRRGARMLGAEPVRVSVSDASGRHERAVSESDLDTIGRVAASPIEDWYPRVPVGPDREMYIRCALHLQRVTEVADFWTPRNLRALARLWSEIGRWPDLRVRQALAFAFTNTAWHGTRMRRFNARGGQRPLTGTLYIPQLSIEVNVADVFAHKIRQLERFFGTVHPHGPDASVLRGSATRLPLPDASVDYCFTDPPFGSNIFYADCAVVWESWLGEVTPTEREAVVNRSLRPDSGGKTLADYAALMDQSLAEIHRVLKKSGWATVVFQSSDSGVWSALRGAVESAGFDFTSVSYLDKTQQSHKGYKGRSGKEDVASFDLVLSLQKRGVRRGARKTQAAIENAAELLRRHLTSLPAIGVDAEADRKRTLPFLHSLLVQAHFNGSVGPEVSDFANVRRLCETHFECDAHGRWASPIEATRAAA